MRSAGAWLCSCLAMVAVLAWMTGCEDGVDYGSNNGSTIAAMGDSITAAGWPGILAGQLGATVINHAVGGTTSIEGAAWVDAALAADRPGYMVILYGANDVIHNIDFGSTMENLRYMIRQARKNDTVPVIGTLTPMSLDHQGYASRARRLSERIRLIGAQEGIRVADLEAAFGDNASLISSDGLHPTNAGSAKIASVFYDAIIFAQSN